MIELLFSLCLVIGAPIIFFKLFNNWPLKCEFCKRPFGDTTQKQLISLNNGGLIVCPQCSIKNDKENSRNRKNETHLNDSGISAPQNRTRYISSATKREVWRRDQGRCVECESKENLEYDHIIPFSRGGSNSVRNIQLLCEPCNRKKSGKIL